MKRMMLGATLALSAGLMLAAGQAAWSGEENEGARATAGLRSLLAELRPPPEAPLTLTKAMDDIPALKQKVSYDLEGATVATVAKWLQDAGVNVILPTSLLPKADDRNVVTMVVKVKDCPLGLIAEQTLAAGGFRHDVKMAEVDGQKVAIVAITGGADARGAGAQNPFMGMMMNRPMGGPPGMGGQGGGQQRGGQRGGQRGNNNAANPNQPAAPEDAF